MTPFATDQWVMLLLVFIAGLLLGMFVLAGGKWKRRYREEVKLREEEVRRREALEADLRHVEARNIAAHARDPVPPASPTRI